MKLFNDSTVELEMQQLLEEINDGTLLFQEFFLWFSSPMLTPEQDLCWVEAGFINFGFLPIWSSKVSVMNSFLNPRWGYGFNEQTLIEAFDSNPSALTMNAILLKLGGSWRVNIKRFVLEEWVNLDLIKIRQDRHNRLQSIMAAGIEAYKKEASQFQETFKDLQPILGGK